MTKEGILLRFWNQPGIWAALIEIHKLQIGFFKKGNKYDYEHVALKHTIFIFTTVGLYLFGIVGFICMDYKDGLRIEILEALYPAITALIFQSMFGTFLLLGSRFMNLLDMVDEMTEKVPERLARMYVFLNRITWIIYLLILIINIILASTSYWFDMHCEARLRTGDKRYVCGQIHYFWFPFEVEDGSLRKILLSFYLSGTQIYAVPFFCASLVGFLAIPLLISLRIRDLGERLKEMDEENFVALVEYYSWISRCVKEMNECVGYTFIFLSISITVLNALLEYLTIIEGTYENLAMMAGCILYEYFFCSVGQRLEDEHEKLVQSVSSLPWYGMSKEMKSNYRLFLGRVQIPLHFKVYPLVEVNNKFLLSVLRGSYSLATFLMNSANRK